MRQEISRLRVSSKRFPSTPPYRHVPSLEMTVAADASLVISMVGAEWRHPTLQIAETTPCTPLVISTVAGQPPIGKPLIVQARGQLRLTWRLYAESPQSGEISLLHGQEGITAGDLSAQSIIEAVSIYPPYRHVPSLEMTVAVDASLVISTVAGQPPIGKPLIVQARGQLRLTWRLYAESPQSGEISLLHGQEGITAGDLSAQSIIEAVFIYPPYRHVPPLEMTVAADASPVISIVGAEWRHPTLQIAETTPCTPLVISMKAQQSGEISFHQ